MPAPDPFAVAGTIVIYEGSPQTVELGSNLASIGVTVTDINGVRLSNELVYWSLTQLAASGEFWNGSTWTQQFQTTVTNVVGQTVSPLTRAIGVPGTWQGLCQCGSNTLVDIAWTITNIAVVPPVLSSITLQSGNNQQAAINSTFTNPLVARFYDQKGNVMPSLAVQMNIQAGSASGALFSNNLTTVTGFTNGSGNFSATLKSGAGLGSISVRVEGNPATAINNFFTATVINAANPSTVARSSGNGQTAGIGVSFGAALVALVTNALGQPLSGISVRFTAPGSGASCSFSGSNTTTVVTNASGLATTVVPIAGANVGTYSVVTDIPAFPAVSAVNFTLTNSAAASTDAGPPLNYCTM